MNFIKRFYETADEATNYISWLFRLKYESILDEINTIYLYLSTSVKTGVRN